MVTKDVWRTEAPKLIRAELEKRLPSETKIINRSNLNSFYHEGEEHRYVTVLFKGVHPYARLPRDLNAIEHDIHMMLWERGLRSRCPVIDYLPGGGGELAYDQRKLIPQRQRANAAGLAGTHCQRAPQYRRPIGGGIPGG